MKNLLYYSTLLLLFTGACTQDKVLQAPHKYAAEPEPKRSNDRSQFKQTRSSVGLGLDLHSKNPYKFRTVDAPPRYKYSKGK